MLNRYGYVLYATFATVSLIGAIAYFSQTGELSGAIALIFVTGVLTLSARSYREPDQKHAEYKEAFMSLGGDDLETVVIDFPAGQTNLEIVDVSSGDRLDPPEPESPVGTDEDTEVTAMLGDAEPPEPERREPRPQTIALRNKLREADASVRKAHSEGRINACLGVIIVPDSLGARDVDNIRKYLDGELKLHDDLDAVVTDELIGGAIVWQTDLATEADTGWRILTSELGSRGAIYAVWSPCLIADTPAWVWYIGLMRQMLTAKNVEVRTVL